MRPSEDILNSWVMMMRTLQSFSCQYEQEYSYVISFMFEYTSPRECHGVRQFIPSMKLPNGHMAIGLVWVWSEVSSENRSEANGWNCNYGWTMANNLSNHTSAVSLKFDQVKKTLWTNCDCVVFRFIWECTVEKDPSSVRHATRTSPSWPTCRNTIWFTQGKSLTNARYVYTG